VVEQRTHKPLVAGSIPASGTNTVKRWDSRAGQKDALGAPVEECRLCVGTRSRLMAGVT
jgi:hypothetical protein